MEGVLVVEVTDVESVRRTVRLRVCRSISDRSRASKVSAKEILPPREMILVRKIHRGSIVVALLEDCVLNWRRGWPVDASSLTRREFSGALFR
jgi:hypothetical protein